MTNNNMDNGPGIILQQPQACEPEAPLRLFEINPNIPSPTYRFKTPVKK